MGHKSSKQLTTSHKILMFGSNSSSKSLFIKHCHLIYKGEFTTEYAIKIKPFILKSLCNAIKEIIQFIKTSNKALYGSTISKTAWFTLKKACSDNVKLCLQMTKHICDLWNDNEFKKGYLHLLDESKRDNQVYLLDNITRIISDNFLPTHEDIMKFKMHSSGSFDTVFEVDDCTYTFVDVGGQRHDRKKWLDHFDDVSVILFFVGLDEYDHPADNDKFDNKMKENLHLFEDIVNNSYFTKSSVVLLVNKDHFKNKLSTSPLSNHFPEYNGKESPEGFLINQFRNRDHHHENRRLFIHTHESDDTAKTQDLFQYVTRMMVKS
ncbi:hypothetical protein SAMD00019534_057460 [Acytostelium subglobosum LB1]|uniref:hypothetical protein n=1 Tax=Acytostelium subglobosum LB1 TaxID=1410327 RepID=UPI0006448F00|nr:hypothetical protein SAMD00019534_057460 [Acytostelium subglobosum LB1]GAM22571.1 hypothetical protein SAMD00019534_057460 [Acytostelium subglobosum LB1]|eukprot:XP_012754691.1 hypothetical protein SAMD00019534_057460 [Acytostelium subglobosum LB1]